MGGRRGLLGIVAGVAILLVGTVAIVLVAGNRPAREYPAGSPEAALQAYLLAWESGDTERAYASFSQAARASITLEEYRRRIVESGGGHMAEGPSRRVYVDRTTLSGERATLDLTVEETWISGLSVNRNRWSRVVSMVREAGAWRFDQLFIGLDMYWPEKEPAVDGP
jgi:hypothetical protein